jgi:adenylate kinase family enzyme
MPGKLSALRPLGAKDAPEAAPRPLAEQEALKYLQKHNLREFFEEIVTQIVVHHPDEPLELALELVKEAVHKRREAKLAEAGAAAGSPLAALDAAATRPKTPDGRPLPATGSPLGGAPLGGLGGAALPALGAPSGGDKKEADVATDEAKSDEKPAEQDTGADETAAGEVEAGADTDVAKTEAPTGEDRENADVVFVLGAPGTGKGTVCAKLAEEFSMAHLSTGDLLRNEVQRKSELGSEIDSFMKEGKMVPTALTVSLLLAAVKRAREDSTVRGVLVDGFPRMVEQISAWSSQVGGFAFVLNLFCEDQEKLVQRMLKRSEGGNSGRSDDDEATMRKRFVVHAEETEPVLDHYRKTSGLVRDVDADCSPEEEVERCRQIVGEIFPSSTDKPAEKEEESSGEPTTTEKTEDKLLENQAGGHQDAFSTSDDGTLTKKCNAGEWTFYNTTLAQNPELIPFVPGFVRVEGTADDNPRVVLKDLTRGYGKPCVMDIKLGTTSAAPDASPEKAASMVAKDEGSTTVSMGVRVVGLKTFNAQDGAWVSRDKPWGKELTDETFADGVRFFFDQPEPRPELVKEFSERIRAVEKFMSEQSKLMFISSSLLFVFDGEPGADPKCELRMIDFAHVFPLESAGARDTGYLTGLTNLLRVFDTLGAATGETSEPADSGSKSDIESQAAEAEEKESQHGDSDGDSSETAEIQDATSTKEDTISDAESTKAAEETAGSAKGQEDAKTGAESDSEQPATEVAAETRLVEEKAAETAGDLAAKDGGQDDVPRTDDAVDEKAEPVVGPAEVAPEMEAVAQSKDRAADKTEAAEPAVSSDATELVASSDQTKPANTSDATGAEQKDESTSETTDVGDRNEQVATQADETASSATASESAEKPAASFSAGSGSELPTESEGTPKEEATKEEAAPVEPTATESKTDEPKTTEEKAAESETANDNGAETSEKASTEDQPTSDSETTKPEVSAEVTPSAEVKTAALDTGAEKPADA